MIHFKGIKAKQSLQNSLSICFILFGFNANASTRGSFLLSVASFMKFFIFGKVLSGQHAVLNESNWSQLRTVFFKGIKTPCLLVVGLKDKKSREERRTQQQHSMPIQNKSNRY